MPHPANLNHNGGPNRMSDQTVQPTPETHDHESVQAQPQDTWNVLIHNDDETPFGYVIYTLSSVFMLSDELAEHIASTAQASGTAIVAVRPRMEAEMLMRVALGRAKSDGYPLQFTMEQS